MTDQTKALLPVTQADRDFAILACRLTGWEGVAQRLEQGWEPDADTNEGKLVEAAARHRRSHSLPGDVGMRALVEEFCLAMEYAAGCDEGIDEDTAASEIMSWAGSPMAVAYTKARAALTPSALSGDAGEGV